MPDRRRPSAAAGVLSSFVALTATPALADEASPIVVVTGHGLAASPATPAYDVETIERDRIVTSASGRIEDVLSSIAGFQQFRRSDSRSSNPSAQGVTLRALGGNASSRTLVLLDGVPRSEEHTSELQSLMRTSYTVFCLNKKKKR